MAECIVGMQFGNLTDTIFFQLEIEPDWVHLRSGVTSETDACRLLTHLHLRYHIFEIPHQLTLGTDSAGLEYLAGISVPRTIAEEHLFPRLTGLADDVTADCGIN